MKDIHSHLIYGVDDGARDIIETQQLLDSALKNGVTDIVLTPHYVLDGRFNKNTQTTESIYNTFKDYNEVKLYLGNEVCINEEIPDLIKNNEVRTINNTKYVLIELYKFAIYPNALNVVHELKINGFIPIIAHAERYDTYMFNYQFFQELINNGCLLQGNYPSLLGYYGKDSEKMLKELLKRKMIYILGSDTHRIDNSKYEMLPKALKKLRHLVDDTYYNELTNENFNKIINNQ